MTNTTASEDKFFIPEQLIQNKLINQLLFIWSFLIVFGLAATQYRAYQIGWELRDAIYMLLSASFVFVALFQRKLSLCFKANFLIGITLTAAIIGFYTLGLFAGGVFLFPVVAMLSAVFYSRKTVITVTVLSIICMVLMASGFLSGIINLNYTPQLLLSSQGNWLTYIISFGFAISVIASTIVIYKQTMKHLLHTLQEQHDELEQALKDVKQLSGLLPICSACKKVRDDNGYWNEIEEYVQSHSNADFSHSVCPDCLDDLYPQLADRIREKMKKLGNS